ncbi:MAG TPA: 4Fe-4S dicluster domain-containing protein [Polyangia bacterium]
MARAAVIDRRGLAALLAALRAAGRRLIGPTVRDGAIVLAPIDGADDLPAGWTAVAEAGRYRLERRADDALFAHAVSPHSWKQHLFVPEVPVWRATRRGPGFTVAAERPDPPPLAFIGARACDLAAIAIQDQILMQGPFADPDYAARRRGAFIVAVNCGEPGGTCFCASMGTGPRAVAGFDLCLTELPGRFLVEVGSEPGDRALAAVPHAVAEPADKAAADAACAAAAGAMGRTFDQTDIRRLLYENLEHPRWDDVAGRCLACTNCTLVCPTCFCATVEDRTDLTAGESTRRRRWDSCFTLGHSYVHGGSMRVTHRSRYRQWLVHKVASWIDQFGVSGCVGCGRCITWCPVAIDITEEVAAIRAAPAARR